MDSRRVDRLMGTVLRCYPARWQRRHGEEAAELAALLIRDGRPVGSVAGSYLAGAAREWLIPRPSRRLRVAACALLAGACSLGIPAGLLASTASARAASTGQAGRPAHCRIDPRADGAGVESGPGHLRVRIGEVWYGQSC